MSIRVAQADEKLLEVDQSGVVCGDTSWDVQVRENFYRRFD